MSACRGKCERGSGCPICDPAVRRIILCGKSFDYPYPHPQAVAVNCTGERGHPGAHRALVWEADHEPYTCHPACARADRPPGRHHPLCQIKDGGA